MITIFKMHILYPFVVIVIGGISVIESIRPISKGGIQHGVAGTNMTLVCKFDMEGEPLYSILWWKGQSVVGKYLPSSKNKMIHHHRKFHSPIYQQLEIDANGHIVGSKLIISQVKTVHEDKYVCEITSDTVGFQTVNSTYYVDVINPPERVPLLFSPRGIVFEGTEIKSYCYSAPTTTQANIKFYINNSPVDETFMTTTKIMRLKSSHVILERGMTFRAHKNLFKNGILLIECRVVLGPGITWKTEASLFLRGYSSEAPGVPSRRARSIMFMEVIAAILAFISKIFFYS